MNGSEKMATRALKVLWEELRNAKIYKDAPLVREDTELKKRADEKIEVLEWMIDRMMEEI